MLGPGPGLWLPGSGWRAGFPWVEGGLSGWDWRGVQAGRGQVAAPGSEGGEDVGEVWRSDSQDLPCRECPLNLASHPAQKGPLNSLHAGIKSRGSCPQPTPNSSPHTRAWEGGVGTQDSGASRTPCPSPAKPGPLATSGGEGERRGAGNPHPGRPHICRTSQAQGKWGEGQLLEFCCLSTLHCAQGPSPALHAEITPVRPRGTTQAPSIPLPWVGCLASTTPWTLTLTPASVSLMGKEGQPAQAPLSILAGRKYSRRPDPRER